MKYKIEFVKKADKEFEAIPKLFQSQIRKKIDALADNPRPQGYMQLHGKDQIYRIRVGNYRVVYCIRDKVLLILILKVGDRKEIYR